MEQGTVHANGIDFAWLAEGPSDGPLALLLHGFPDSAWTWQHLLSDLAADGYRAVAPFMRGYAPTDVPADGRYQAGALVADAHALHGALGGDARAVLIGHDWGAMAAYGAAAFGGLDMWSRVVTMAVPPPHALGGLFLDYDQLKRSFYMFFFQLPLAEAVVGMNDLDFLARLWADWSPGFDGPEHVAHARDALRAPENMTAALGYYRALISGEVDPALAAEQAAAASKPPQPLLYLHGANDRCIGPDLIAGPNGSYPDTVLVEGVGHFLHLEQPAVVNRMVLDFLRA
ncbi:MAG: hypothetical protein QOI20_1575 [Acidimicrobiaceae bacterium]|jgi:pimeloyl-ACP methyl ester carboxylesterase|nr:hypothetical protein [Acidimicrobiaceae bacterium]